MVSFSGTGLDGGTATSVACAVGGTFTASVALSSGDGNKEIRIAQEDAVGNEGHVDLTLSLTETVTMTFTGPGRRQGLGRSVPSRSRLQGAVPQGRER